MIRSRSMLALAGVVMLLAFGARLALSPSAAEEGRAIPPPVLDEQAADSATTEVAVLAGGCFWGVQGVF